MKLIVGLGNPDEQYKDTRHNVGYMVVEALAKQLTSGPNVTFSFERKYKALIFDTKYKDEKLYIVKPQTYMNNSGWSVEPIASMYKIPREDIWVVHDDIDLPLGKVRIRLGGGSGGHNGVESIITKLGTDQFMRFRLGVGRGKLDEAKSTAHNLHRQAVEEFVLAPFFQSEAGAARTMIKHAEKAVMTALKDGIEKAMNQFN